MKINSLTKIIELVKQHPFIMDELIKLSPKAKKLNNPILQRTIGKRATLADVSKIINIPSNVLITRISSTLENAGIQVEMEKGDAPETKWYDKLADRQNQLKELVLSLHDGTPMDKLKKKFKEIIQEVSASELAELSP